MKTLFENITNDECNALKWFLSNRNSFPADYFINDPTVDGRIQELENAGLLYLNPEGVQVTELGRAAIVEHDKTTRVKRLRLFWEVVRFVVPTTISIIALVVSLA